MLDETFAHPSQIEFIYKTEIVLWNSVKRKKRKETESINQFSNENKWVLFTRKKNEKLIDVKIVQIERERENKTVHFWKQNTENNHCLRFFIDSSF